MSEINSNGGLNQTFPIRIPVRCSALLLKHFACVRGSAKNANAIFHSPITFPVLRFFPNLALFSV